MSIIQALLLGALEALLSRNCMFLDRLMLLAHIRPLLEYAPTVCWSLHLQRGSA